MKRKLIEREFREKIRTLSVRVPSDIFQLLQWRDAINDKKTYSIDIPIRRHRDHFCSGSSYYAENTTTVL